MIHKVYLQVDLPALAGTGVAWVDHVGHHLIDNVTIEIGGQTIDQHYGTWLQIWNELTQTAEKEAGYNVMIGNDDTRTTTGTSVAGTTLYVPLQFWLNTDLKSNLYQIKKDNLIKYSKHSLISMINN